ncbi:tripartite tricarboxylate transporter substrate binding protein [Bradyrhizobium sp. dw_78]|uniref:Bug family tripartite tricarboxylate transporter substrate binding protein n=1 Tax=Bradyrhizobium sp. dw_78 TaxID=2719793 RepID=UPI001BD4EB8D|nr:tripartite tricarboxylate transporter substrate binding protein [Bradyrhizobium sp. dw_78]
MRFVSRIIRLGLLASCVCTALEARAESANDYPSRSIRIDIPFTPGGPTDLLARGLAKHFNADWKQTAIVENRPGAGGIVTLRVALDAPRDGYTLVLHSDGMSITPAVYATLPFDTLRDFIPIAMLAKTPNAVVVGEDSPYHTLAELVAAGQSSGKISYASAGIGSAQQMQAAKFASRANMKDPIHVPFKGTPEALTAVMAGRVDFVFAPMANAVPLIKAGKLRPLAISSAERSPLLPDVPSVAESGYPGFSEEQWWGLFAPAGVPQDVIEKIEAETKAAVETDDMKNLITQLSSSPGEAYGEQFGKILKADIETNTAAAKAAHIEAK